MCDRCRTLESKVRILTNQVIKLKREVKKLKRKLNLTHPRLAGFVIVDGPASLFFMCRKTEDD
jgi:hypothetical protein